MAPRIGLVGASALVVVGAGATSASLAGIGAGSPWESTARVAVSLGVSLALAMALTELAAAMPLAGGPYAWTRRAFGGGWGFQVAWWRIIAAVADAALTVSVAGAIIAPRVAMAIGGPADWTSGAQLVSSTAVVLVVSLVVGVWPPTAWWLAVTGAFALVLAALVGTMVEGAVATMEALASTSAAGGTTGVAGLLAGAWAFSAWDSLAPAMGEVREPRKVVPRAMVVAFAIVAALLLLPLFQFMVGRPGIPTWIADEIARDILEVGLVAALAGRCAACLLVAGHLVSSLAEDRYFTHLLARTPGGAIRRWVVVAFGAATMAVILVPIGDRVVILGVTWGAAMFGQLVALVVLRAREPAIVRPYLVPGGLTGVGLCAAVPLAWFGVTAAGALHSLGFASLAVAGGCVASAPVAWVGLTILVKRGRPNRAIAVEFASRAYDATWAGTLEVRRLREGGPAFAERLAAVVPTTRPA